MSSIEKNSSFHFVKTLSHFKNYLGANIATKALGFISIPILTRLLTTEEYGIVNVFMSYVAIITVLSTLNMHSSVGRYFYEDSDDFNDFFSTTVIISIFCLTISFSFFFLFEKQLTFYMNLPKGVIIYFFPITIFAIIYSLFQQIYMAQRQSGKIASINIVRAYLGLSLNVAIILLLKENRYLGFIWSYTIMGLCLSCYILSQLKPYFNFTYKKKHLIYIGKFSIPLIPYALSGIILGQFDRIMINSYIGAGSAGLYSFAYNVGMLLTIFTTSLNAAWIPTYYKYMKEEQYRAHDREVNYILRLMLFAAIILIFFGKELGMLLAKENYHAALRVIPIVVMGYVFHGIFTVYGRNIGYAKKTIFNSAILLTSGVVNILLNAFFIPKYGYIASAYTTLVSYFIMATLAWIVSKYVLRLYSAPLRLIVYPLISVFPLILGYYLIEGQQILFLYKFFLKFLLVLVAIFILFYKWIFIFIRNYSKR